MLIDNIKLIIHEWLNDNIPVILTYHSVIDYPLEFDIWTHMPLRIFEEHMEYLSHKAHVISLHKLASGLKSGNLPKNSVAITFDDGFANNFTHAYPLLCRYELPATIFLSTGFIGRNRLFWPERIAYQVMKTQKRNVHILDQNFSIKNSSERRYACNALRDLIKTLSGTELERELTIIEDTLEVDYDYNDPLFQEWLPLSWNQIRQMSSGGLIDFGGHTVDHTILSSLHPDKASTQISLCRKMLDENLLSQTKMWAYPNGTSADFNDSHKVMLKNHGFSFIFTTMGEYLSANSNLEQLGRWGVGSTLSVSGLRGLLAKRNRWRGLSGSEKLRVLWKSIGR